jgi:hypothetical protein
MARSDPHDTIYRQTTTDMAGARQSAFRPLAVSRTSSALPDDALAIIERPARSVTQAGKSRHGGWVLRFQPRGRTYVEPLMGWVGNDDPLAHLTLRFSTLQAAIRYAQRQGLAYEVREPPRTISTTGGSQKLEKHRPLRICCWPTGPHALCCGNYPLSSAEAG